MKILHISPSYFPAFQFGGPIQSVHLLNRELVKSGASVDVFTTNAGLDPKIYNASQWTDLQGVKVKYFSYFGYVHYNFSIPIFIALIKNVRYYDVLHITAVWNFPVWAACFACWWHKKPYIISPRGTIYPETIAIKSSLFKKLYYYFVAKKCLLRASAIHFTSVDEEEKVKNFLRLKVKSIVIPNGINLDEFKIETSPIQNYTWLQKPYILFLGRINHKKGLDILYKAFEEIVNQNPTVKLVIVGPDSDNYKLALDKLAEELHIATHLTYAGQLEGDAKIIAYKNALCFALTSYSENFGMSVVEALACGCPVVISDKVGIFPEIKNNNAGLVTSLDYLEVAKAINSLILNSRLRDELIHNGLKTVERLYSIEGVALKFIQLYKTLTTHVK